MTNGCAGFSVQGESGALLALFYFTTRVRFTLELAPFGAVAFTISGYDPGCVAEPPGDFARLLHADSPTANKISAPNDSTQRGLL